MGRWVASVCARQLFVARAPSDDKSTQGEFHARGAHHITILGIEANAQLQRDAPTLHQRDILQRLRQLAL